MSLDRQRIEALEARVAALEELVKQLLQEDTEEDGGQT